MRRSPKITVRVHAPNGGSDVFLWRRDMPVADALAEAAQRFGLSGSLTLTTLEDVKLDGATLARAGVKEDDELVVTPNSI